MLESTEIPLTTYHLHLRNSISEIVGIAFYFHFQVHMYILKYRNFDI